MKPAASTTRLGTAKKRNGANSALRARKGESPECKLCATHNRRSILENMNCNFDLDCLLGAKPKIQRNNGRFVKGMIPHNKGKKWNEWMDGRKQRKVRNCLIHTGNPTLPGWNRKAIIAIKDGKEYWFESSMMAAKKLNLCGRNIRHVAEGKRKSCGGFQFKWA